MPTAPTVRKDVTPPNRIPDNTKSLGGAGVGADMTSDALMDAKMAAVLRR